MNIKISDQDKFLASKEIPIDFTAWEPKETITICNKFGDEEKIVNWKLRYTDYNYKGLLVKFVDECVEYGVTLQDIGDLLGLSKQYVHRLYRYGEAGWTHTGKKRIYKRDNFRCKICKQKKKRLHAHHIASPRDGSDANLITLCDKCHGSVEQLKIARVKAGEKIKDFSYADPLIKSLKSKK